LDPKVIDEYRHMKRIEYIDGFHPGVSMAIHKYFGEVNHRNGFWWIFVINGKFSLNPQ
jgi:hypothetical protein